MVVITGNILSRLYSLVILLHTQGYFLRMLRSLPSIFEAAQVKSIQMFGEPPPAAKAYSREVMSYMLSHYKRFERATQKKQVHHWIEASFDTDSDSDGEVLEFEVCEP